MVLGRAVADLDVDTLLALAERVAIESHDGHLTILRFTTHWKCAFGTVDTGLEQDARAALWALPAFPTLREALVALLLRPHGP